MERPDLTALSDAAVGHPSYILLLTTSLSSQAITLAISVSVPMMDSISDALVAYTFLMENEQWWFAFSATNMVLSIVVTTMSQTGVHRFDIVYARHASARKQIRVTLIKLQHAYSSVQHDARCPNFVCAVGLCTHRSKCLRRRMAGYSPRHTGLACSCVDCADRSVLSLYATHLYYDACLCSVSARWCV